MLGACAAVMLGLRVRAVLAFRRGAGGIRIAGGVDLDDAVDLEAVVLGAVCAPDSRDGAPAGGAPKPAAWRRRADDGALCYPMRSPSSPRRARCTRPRPVALEVVPSLQVVGAAGGLCARGLHREARGDENQGRDDHSHERKGFHRFCSSAWLRLGLSGSSVITFIRKRV